jgi:hypothetical protein
VSLFKEQKRYKRSLALKDDEVHEAHMDSEGNGKGKTDEIQWVAYFVVIILL